jgi:16S rRNA (guanine(966)-N(2))-methyltransferase RsmD
MRIIGGNWGGRKIHPPSKMPYTRPTTDVAKEALFNMLQNQLDFDGLETLDLFGGTGAITYELLSRGAGPCTIVEKDEQMHRFIVKNLDHLGAQNVQVVRQDVFKFLEQHDGAFDFIFAGPPYALKNIDDLPQIVMQRGKLKPGGLFVLEHTPANHYGQSAGFVQQRNYGTTVFSFFENAG